MHRNISRIVILHKSKSRKSIESISRDVSDEIVIKVTGIHDYLRSGYGKSSSNTAE